MRPLLLFLFIMFSAQSIFSQNASWIQRNPLPQNDFYAIKFFNQNTGYVIGSNGVILKNTAGSNNWINIPSGTNNNLYGMYFFDVNHGYIVGSDRLIMYTSNGGVSWTTSFTPGGSALRSITFVNSTTGFAVGDNGTIIKTTNGGTNWNASTIASVNLRSVFFTDVNTGFACGDSGSVMKTTNAGVNWTSQTVTDASIMCVYFTNQLTGFLATSGPYSYSHPLRTTDAGNSWSPISFFRIQGNWNSVNFINPDTGFLAGYDNLVMRTTDGGYNWSEMGVPSQSVLLNISTVDSVAFISGTGGWITEISLNNYFKNLGGTRNDLRTISFINENSGITISDFGYLRTTNSGINWDIDRYGYYSWEEGCAGILISVIFFSPYSGYRITEDVNCHGWYSFYSVDNSTDGGVTWSGNKSFRLQNIGIGGICEAEGITYIIAGTPNASIYKNNGTGWNQVYTASTCLRSISFANANTGIALLCPYPDRGYIRTTNGGNQWTSSITGNRYLNDVKMFSSGFAYIAADSMFGKSTDFGATWTWMQNNFHGNMQFQFYNENTGWMLTGGKLYNINNYGTNFIQLNSLGIFSPKSMSFVNDLTGFVCGDSGTVYKTTDGGLTFVDPVSQNAPNNFYLYQNYPNPFNPVTKIKFDVPTSKGDRGMIRLTVFDALGREVTTLINKQLQPGSYSVDWDATNYPSGVYFYKLEAGDYAESKKMVLIK